MSELFHFGARSQAPRGGVGGALRGGKMLRRRLFVEGLEPRALMTSSMVTPTAAIAPGPAVWDVTGVTRRNGQNRTLSLGLSRK